MHSPTDLSPLSQHLNTGLPVEVLYQPDVVGGSLALGRGVGTDADFWDELGKEAADATPHLGAGANTRQRLNDFAFIAKAASKQALQGNKRRTYLAIQNKGAVSVFVSFGKPATLNSFEIPPGPGFFEPILGTTSSVYIISAAGDVMMTIIEGYRETA